MFSDFEKLNIQNINPRFWGKFSVFPKNDTNQHSAIHSSDLSFWNKICSTFLDYYNLFTYVRVVNCSIKFPFEHNLCKKFKNKSIF